MEDDEREAWKKQFYSNFGGREYLRFTAAFIAWILVGAAVGALMQSTLVFMLFLLMGFVAPLSIHFSRRAYRVYRFILGNPNLPENPPPRSKVKPVREPLPWWAYIPSIWFWILALATLYFAIRYFLK